MKNINSISGKATKIFGRSKLTVKKYSPEIALGVGVVGVIGATVLACRATLKIDTVLDDAKEKIDEINALSENEKFADKYTKEDAVKDKALVYFQTGIQIGRLYGPSVVVGATSIGLIIGGHKIMKSRITAISAAYTASERAFKDFRRRVAEEFGEDKVEEYKYGIIRSEETVEVKDEVTGRKKKVKETVERLDPNHISQYARFFDEGNINWHEEPEFSLMFLRAQQNHANDLLKARGHVFLNDVYDMLGMDRSQTGSVVGWVDGEGDSFIDFGIYEGDKRRRMFVNGEERNILLDFNVDGLIWDLI